MTDIEKFHKLIAKARNILITSHYRPDQDAICSTLALKYYLGKRYEDKKITVGFTGDKIHEMDYISGIEEINWYKDIAGIVNKFDTLILVDANTWNRASYTPELIDPGKFTTICIDHHPNEPDPFDLDLSDVNAASATQRVYTLFLRDEKETLVIPEIAKLLMYGLLADSGSFRYVNVAKADTLMIAHELVKLGNLDIQLLEDDIEQLSVEEFEVVQTYVRNMKNIELSGIPPLSYSFIPRDYYGKYSEGVLKNAGMRFKHLFIRQIKGHNWGFVVSPYANGEINVSFRSKPGAPNIRDLAVLFGGGGHIRAASGFYDPRPGEENIDSEEVCQRVIEVIKNTKLKMVA